MSRSRLAFGSRVAVSAVVVGLAAASSGGGSFESVAEAAQVGAGHSVVQIVDARDPLHPCSGTSLTDRWVLTSANCVRDAKGVASAVSLRVTGNGNSANGA